MQKTQHIKSNSFLTMILVIVCLFTASVFMYKYVIDKTIDNKELTIESIKEEQFNVIWSTLETLQLQAEKNVTTVSKEIEEDILILSPEELDLLQEDMNNDILNKNLHKILNSHIKGEGLNGIKNHMNGIVVMTTDGYIEDYNYYRATDSNDSNVRKWEDAIDNSYNKDLERDAINKLLNRTSGFIALESYNLIKNDSDDAVDNHTLIKELTYDSLLKVFLDEGFDGLRNYQIFVPYYITDFGDIFGNPDIMHGTKLDNNKLIIVQEFNLYDQISIQYDLFYNEQIKNVTHRYNELLRLLYILGISLVASVVGLIFYLCNIYNRLLIHESEYELHEDKYEDNIFLDDEEFK